MHSDLAYAKIYAKEYETTLNCNYGKMEDVSPIDKMIWAAYNQIKII